MLSRCGTMKAQVKASTVCCVCVYTGEPKTKESKNSPASIFLTGPSAPAGKPIALMLQPLICVYRY